MSENLIARRANRAGLKLKLPIILGGGGGGNGNRGRGNKKKGNQFPIADSTARHVNVDSFKADKKRGDTF